MFGSKKILFVVENDDNAPLIKSNLYKEASLRGLNSFEILTLPKSPKDKVRRLGDLHANAERIEEALSSDGYSLTIGLRDSAVDWNALGSEYPIKLATSIKTLRAVIKNALEERGLDWLSHASREWEKSSLRYANPTEWLEQFSRLGCKDLGRNLLKLLRVVSGGECRDAFALNASDVTGLRVRHACIKDDDPGSSTETIRPTLIKMHGPDILTLDLDNTSEWNPTDTDVIYVYEDGLWSGVEAVKRLRAIHRGGSNDDLSPSIIFKFAVTSDIGLIAARSAIRQLRMSNIQFHGARHPENHLRFLSSEFSNDAVVGFDTEHVRKYLDSLVLPAAFSSEDLWGSDLAQNMKIAQELGAQLVVDFLTRREQKSQTDPTPVIEQEKISNWSLGAMGFASTIVFEASIPKPVIPLMWLQGEVERNGVRIPWKPLFFDARRVGSGMPLN